MANDQATTDATGSARGFTTAQIVAVMLIAVMSSLVVALQPLLLGPLATEGRLTLQEIGRTAMVEALGMAIAIAFSGALFETRRLRILIIAALAVSVLANAASTVVRHEMILAARFVNGLSVGILLWIWTGLLTRAELPSRLVAIFLVLQSSGALVLSWLFSNYLMPRVGASGGYACLAVASAVAGALTFAAPSEYRALANEEPRRFHLPSGRGFAGLFAVVLHMAAIMAFWVYVLPLGREKGLPEGFVALTASVALASQIAGALCAAIFARLTAPTTLVSCLALSVCGLLLIRMGVAPTTFLVGTTLIVFLWMFAPAYQMPFLLQVDPSRRAGMQMITAQVLGLSIGPALASLALQGARVAPTILVSGGLYVLSAALVVGTTAGRPPPN